MIRYKRPVSTVALFAFGGAMSEMLTIGDLVARANAAEARAAAAHMVAHRMLDAMIDELAEEIADDMGDSDDMGEAAGNA